MLGEKIGETKGKRLVRRVLSTDPPTVEVSFEDSGQLAGVPVTGLGSYTAIVVRMAPCLAGPGNQYDIGG